MDEDVHDGPEVMALVPPGVKLKSPDHPYSGQAYPVQMGSGQRRDFLSMTAVADLQVVLERSVAMSINLTV